MGSPVAPVLANLYMEYYETELWHSLPGPQPPLWLRYMDDILLQWKHSIEEFNIFLQRLNNLDPLINLRMNGKLWTPPILGQLVSPS